MLKDSSEMNIFYKILVVTTEYSRGMRTLFFRIDCSVSVTQPLGAVRRLMSIVGENEIHTSS